MSAELIDRYEILAEIGHGGMATVYLGRDPEGQEVAIKVLRPEYLTDLGFRARFEREAQTVAALEHPAIVPLLAFGRHDGQPFLVMPYMPGGSLAQSLRQAALSPQAADDVLTRIASALDSAHARGMVHGDLKPSNILLDADGQAYLADFGIATQAAPGGVDRDIVGGTPAYMSPEQCRPGQEVDGRSDIYSLGVTLFQMLTGRLPFDGDTPLAILAQHVHQSPLALHSLNPDLPAALQPVIDRSLRKEAAARYQTAGEFSAAYKSALANPSAEVESADASRAAVVVAEVKGTADESGPGAHSSPDGALYQWRSLQEGVLHRAEAAMGWLATHFAVAMVLVSLLGALCAATAVMAIRGSVAPQARSSNDSALLPLTEAAFLAIVRVDDAAEDAATPTVLATLVPAITPEGAPVPNLLLVYTDARMSAINVSSEDLSLRGLTFIRPEAEGTGPAVFAANEWGGAARGSVAALSPGECLQLIDLDSASRPQAPPPCNKIRGWIGTRREERLFFRPAAGASDFEIRRGEQFIGRCTIGNGECRLYLPQP